ncbi:MAG: Crp/Fnr family transcriptional regulator [Ruminiclostridium sp.]|nr:Crp/Fnr family transcriptional regulator [Ruminiclostridium sp.]
MEQFFAILSRCSLFAGVGQEEMGLMLHCLGARERAIPKGEPVFLEGDPAGFIGVVLEGAVQVVRDDYYGTRSVLAVIQPGEIFGEAFSCAGVETMPVSAFALKGSKVLWLDCKRMLTVCSNACQFHNRMVANLLRAVARKNLALSRKIQFMSQKTTKEKIMAYLLDQAKVQGCAAFTIPHDRQALADFLGVERSAMSAEIGKLKKAGILDCKGPWFHLRDTGEEEL